MTPPTLATRPDASPPDLNEAADDMARLFDLADEIRALPPERRPARISAFLAYTGHLAGLVGGTHDEELHDELAGRLWMVCASPLEVHDLAATAAASWAERLIDDTDAVGITRACLRTLTGSDVAV